MLTERDSVLALYRRPAPWSLGLAAVAGLARLLAFDPAWITMAVVVLGGLVAPLWLSRSAERPGVVAIGANALLLTAPLLPLVVVATLPDVAELLGVLGVTAFAAFMTAAFAVACRSAVRDARPALVAAAVVVAGLWLTPLVSEPFPSQEAPSVYVVLSGDAVTEAARAAATSPSWLGCMNASLDPPSTRDEAGDWLTAASPLELVVAVVGSTSGGPAAFRADTAFDNACAGGEVPVWPRSLLAGAVLALAATLLARGGRALAARRRGAR